VCGDAVTHIESLSARKPSVSGAACSSGTYESPILGRSAPISGVHHKARGLKPQETWYPAQVVGMRMGQDQGVDAADSLALQILRH